MGISHSLPDDLGSGKFLQWTYSIDSTAFLSLYRKKDRFYIMTMEEQLLEGFAPMTGVFDKPLSHEESVILPNEIIGLRGAIPSMIRTHAYDQEACLREATLLSEKIITINAANRKVHPYTGDMKRNSIIRTLGTRFVILIARCLQYCHSIDLKPSVEEALIVVEKAFSDFMSIVRIFESLLDVENDALHTLLVNRTFPTTVSDMQKLEDDIRVSLGLESIDTLPFTWNSKELLLPSKNIVCALYESPSPNEIMSMTIWSCISRHFHKTFDGVNIATLESRETLVKSIISMKMHLAAYIAFVDKVYWKRLPRLTPWDKMILADPIAFIVGSSSIKIASIDDKRSAIRSLTMIGKDISERTNDNPFIDCLIFSSRNDAQRISSIIDHQCVDKKMRVKVYYRVDDH